IGEWGCACYLLCTEFSSSKPRLLALPANRFFHSRLIEEQPSSSPRRGTSGLSSSYSSNRMCPLWARTTHSVGGHGRIRLGKRTSRSGLQSVIEEPAPQERGRVTG